MIWPQIRVSRCEKPFGQPLWKNSWIPRKPLVFHRTVSDTKDLTLYSSSSMSETLWSNLMENSWFPPKTSGFPQNDTRYQGSDLIFEFLDVENTSVNPYGTFVVSLKIDVFLTFADTQTSKQASNQTIFFQDSSLREREQPINVSIPDSSNISHITTIEHFIIWKSPG